MAGNSTGSDNHVVIITPGFPINEKDENCLPSVTGYIRALAKEIGNNAITVISLQHPETEGWYTWHGIKVYSAGGKNKKGLYRFFTMNRAKKAFNEVKKSHSNIVVHSLWLTATAFLGEKLAAKNGFTHVASILGQDALPSNTYLKLLDPKKTTVIANSDFAATVYTASTNQKVAGVIPIGINSESYTSADKSDAQYDLVSVGNLHELKQFHIVIRLVEHLKIKYPNLKAAIAGDGPDRDELQHMLNEKGLQSSIKLVGEVKHSEILKFIKSGKVFVHPSRYEASSHAMLEANYAGLPVVCMKVGYYPVPGYVYQCDTYAAMHEKIASLLGVPLRLPPAEVPMINETVRRYRTLYKF